MHTDESQVECQRTQRPYRGEFAGRVYLWRNLRCMTSAGALVTESVVPGGSQMEHANNTTEPAAVELLSPCPAAQSTVHDAEFATLVTPLPQMQSISAMVSYGMVHRIGSHVNMPTYRASRLRMSCWYLAVHCTMQETVAGNLRCTAVTSLPPLPSICAKDTDGMVYSRARKRKAPTSPTSMPRWS